MRTHVISVAAWSPTGRDVVYRLLVSGATWPTSSRIGSFHWSRREKAASRTSAR